MDLRNWFEMLTSELGFRGNSNNVLHKRLIKQHF